MSSRGFSMLEVIIAMVILGLIAFGVFRFQSQTVKMVRVTTDKAALSRALLAIERDVVRDMPFVPPQEEKGADETKRDSSLFKDALKSDERCYDKSGDRMPDCSAFDKDATIYFKAQFYKARVRDASLHAESPLNNVPLARVRFRVVYKVNNKVQDPYYFSRLVTDVLRY